jgi:hypothetical protein
MKGSSLARTHLLLSTHPCAYVGATVAPFQCSSDSDSDDSDDEGKRLIRESHALYALLARQRDEERGGGGEGS